MCTEHLSFPPANLTLPAAATEASHPTAPGPIDLPVIHTTGKERRRIVVRDGFWWLHDPTGRGTICLDPLFGECDWKVGTLANQLGLGERTLSRMVDESTGLTPKQWLQWVRIVKSRHMLRGTEKIEPLAITLGFGQHSDFTREFKKQTGVLPSEFVQSERRRCAEWNGQRHG